MSVFAWDMNRRWYIRTDIKSIIEVFLNRVEQIDSVLENFKNLQRHNFTNVFFINTQNSDTCCIRLDFHLDVQSHFAQETGMNLEDSRVSLTTIFEYTDANLTKRMLARQIKLWCLTQADETDCVATQLASVSLKLSKIVTMNFSWQHVFDLDEIIKACFNLSLYHLEKAQRQEHFDKIFVN